MERSDAPKTWADDLADRAGAYGMAEWMNGFLQWIDHNAEVRHEEGSDRVSVTSPSAGLSCTLKPLPAYARASPEEKSTVLVLDDIAFDPIRMAENNEPLPFGLDYQGETVETAMQKIGTDDTSAGTARAGGRVSFFLPDGRVVELAFGENGQILKVFVTRLMHPIDIRTSEVVFVDPENEEEEDEEQEEDGYEDDDDEEGEIHFVTACALGKDRLFAIVQSDDRPDTLCVFQTKPGSTEEGVRHDVGTTDVPIEKACLYSPKNKENERIAMVSESGNVLLSRQGKIAETEDIPDVRARGQWSFLSDVQQIGDHLYACGSYGQVYKRFGANDWRHVDGGLLQPIESTDYADLLKLYAVKGPHENAIYAAGARNDRKQAAKAFFYNGSRWTEIALPKETGFIADIHVESESKVWMCGDSGTLLLGNAQKGFKKLDSSHPHRYFSSICLFGGAVYIATEQSLLAYRPGGLFGGGKMEALYPDLDDVHLRNLHTLTARNNVLWAIGEDTIVRFDGKNWTVVYDES